MLKPSSTLLATFICGASLIAGCTSHSDQVDARADRFNRADALIANGKKQITQGDAEVSRGQSLIKNGDLSNGQAAVDNGRSLQTRGSAQVENGTALRNGR